MLRKWWKQQQEQNKKQEEELHSLSTKTKWLIGAGLVMAFLIGTQVGWLDSAEDQRALEFASQCVELDGLPIQTSPRLLACWDKAKDSE